MDRLEFLESESIKLLRDTPKRSKKPLIFWSTGKDSTLLLVLVKKAFGKIPWPVVHVDTGKKPQEVYDFRQKYWLEWSLPLFVKRNELAIQARIDPGNTERLKCCGMLKTECIKDIVREKQVDSFVCAIRNDESPVRGMEDLISLRDEHGHWNPQANYGGFGVKTPEQEGLAHIRVNPILMWTEAEVWQYTMLHQLPVNPLYFAKEYEDGKWYRYRSLGCKPCTIPVESKADTITKITSEVYDYPGIERAGRLQELGKSEEVLMWMKAQGYFG